MRTNVAPPSRGPSGSSERVDSYAKRFGFLIALLVQLTQRKISEARGEGKHK